MHYHRGSCIESDWQLVHSVALDGGILCDPTMALPTPPSRFYPITSGLDITQLCSTGVLSTQTPTHEAIEPRLSLSNATQRR